MKKTVVSGISLFVIALLFVATTLLINRFLTGAQIDLTERGLYTTSSGARQILKSIDEPINLYFFFSERSGNSISAMREHAKRVREMLNNFNQIAGGKLNITFVDPEPFSEAEDRALDFGLRGIKLPNQGDFYFGLVGTNAVGKKKLIPFFHPQNAAFLEYDLAKLVHELSRPHRPVLGLYSSLPISGDYDFIQKRAVNTWTIFDQLNAQFDVRLLDEGFDEIDPAVDVLMVVHPKALPVETLYAIDQFVVRGGNALFFVDPFAEVEVVIKDNPYNDRMSDKSSGLERLFDSWGITVSRQDILADRTLAVPVNVGQHTRPVTHLTVLGFGEDNFNTNDIITRQLSSLNVAHAGFIEYTSMEDEITMTPLIFSTVDSGAIPVDNVRFNTDPTRLLDAFAPDHNQKNLAVRLEGLFSSAFDDSVSAALKTQRPHQATATLPSNLVIMADTDLLQDPLWVRVQEQMGQKIVAPFANNADFISNAIDNLSGSDSLISIRGRGEYIRPFNYVNNLRKTAEALFRETEQRLVKQLAQTEKQIQSLQKQRENQDAVFMTPEQEIAITQFTKEKAKIRKELREVRHQLDKNIERLGSVLRVINILLIPLLVALFGIIVAILKLRHRYRKNHSKKVTS